MASLPAAYRVSTVASASKIWRGPLYFCILLTALLAAAFHEVCIQQSIAFGSGSLGWQRYLGVWASLLMLLPAWLVGRRLRSKAQHWLSPLCLLSALCVAGSGVLLFSSFSKTGFLVLRILVPACTALVLGVSAVVAHAALATLARQLQLLPRLLSPLRLSAVLFASLAGIALAPMLGLLRTPLLVAGLLALLGFWYCQLFAYLEQRPLKHARRLEYATCSVGLLCAMGFAASEAWVSRPQLRYFQHPILEVERERAELVVTTGPIGLQFFVNRSLRFTDVDGYRYFEALVHPALALHHDPRRVLLLGFGDGFAAREVLLYEAVQELRVVAEDSSLRRLARTAQWLRQRTDDAMLSPKLHFTEAEPIVWLSQQQRQRYDVILVDLPDAASPRWGKNYTRYFYERVAAHLEPDGVAVVQGTPIFGAPRSFANIQASVRAAGLNTLAYRAAVPSIGDWGFLLASRQPLQPPRHLTPKTRFLGAEGLKSLFAIPRDSRANGGEPSTLYEQHLLPLMQKELARRL